MMLPAYEFVRQEWWGGLIALYLFLGGVGSMGFIIAYYYWRKNAPRRLVLWGSAASVILVLVGILALVLDLTNPAQAYKVYLYPHKSWIYIGTWLLTFFVIFGGAFALPLLSESLFGWLKPLMGVTGFLGSVFGFGVALYTGLLLGAVKSIPFWNTPLLPVLFLVSAFSTGMSFYNATIAPQLLRLSGEEERVLKRICHRLAYTDGLVMLFELLLIAVMLLTASEAMPGYRESVRLLTTGDLAPLFIVGMLIIGLIVPVILIFGYETRPGGQPNKKLYSMILSGVLVLIGGFILRYVILKAGVLQVPLT